LRSKTDRLKPLQVKLAEYIENGAQLDWLIDPIQHKTHLYRPNAPVEILNRPKTLSGEALLPGFVLKLDGVID
jgi:Uma2 family endonuclease